MRTVRRNCLALVLLLAAGAAAAQTPATWREGENYFLIQPAQPTNLPAGKVEVTEVFSYACPACYRFFPTADRLKSSLPANAVMNYVPAAFNPSEDWPVFQQAYYAAQALGIAAKTHDAMFNAVWQTGQLAIVDQGTDRLKDPLPSIENIAEFYHRAAGVSTEQFVAAANSFSTNVKTRQADAFIQACQVDQTPTIIVNGKYRVTVPSAGGYDQLIALVKYLVAKESR
ncbi:MAG TPA: thiol:disulfide interchange protein DsbA/DsbL [Steroidobacteraceae bacterium]|nr:thiol:disulfide interchange protein DsbA/DsbL [Steroidobacteraceae bacterium]